MNESSLLVEWAQRIGPQALPAFLVLLVVSTTTGGVIHSVWRRRRMRLAMRVDSQQPERLLGGLAIGFGGIVMAASLFAWIAWHVTSGDSLGLADQALADAIGAHLPPAALRFFGHFTHVGDPSVLITLAAIVVASTTTSPDVGMAVGPGRQCGTQSVAQADLRTGPAGS
jgi:hypothetical protein